MFVLIVALNRAMIPGYFSSMFDGGVRELYIMLNFPREFTNQAGITMECENALIITQYHQPGFARVSKTEHPHSRTHSELVLLVNCIAIEYLLKTR